MNKTATLIRLVPSPPEMTVQQWSEIDDLLRILTLNQVEYLFDLAATQRFNMPLPTQKEMDERQQLMQLDLIQMDEWMDQFLLTAKGAMATNYLINRLHVSIQKALWKATSG